MNVEQYLSRFQHKVTDRPSLKAMKFMMEELGHPEKDIKVIHIAGTNGKGSCVEMMTNILVHSGYKVGKFISPHLIRYNERISINNQDITDEELEQLIIQIQPKIERYEKFYHETISLFELETTMALQYFYEKQCDLVVLETGLGGLYDSTNIVHSFVSIITSVGYDHMNALGSTLLEIAQQKAGIIKENSETIFVEQEEEEINQIIKQTCKDKNNTLHLIQEKEIQNCSYDQEFQMFDYEGYQNILINLKGKKQFQNAAICIKCIEILNNKGYPILEKALREGLKTVVHKARFETIYHHPLVIYDGAHNEPAIKNFRETVQMYYQNQNKVYIVSILKSKDYQAILRELLQDETATFIFTNGNDKQRYVAKEELLKTAKQYTNNEKLYMNDIEDAINFVKEKYQDCVTFFVGSFYIYGTVIEKLKDKENKMDTIILASNNQNKLRELKEILKKFDIDVISQKEAGFDIEVEETGTNFTENAILKAKAVYNLIGKPIIADDSGLSVDFLHGEPGVYSHRYAGPNATDEDRNQKILNLMKDVHDKERTARFECAICYIDEEGKQHVFEGVCEGKIAREPKGENGFGYDPIFLVSDKTFAELSQEEKNQISHRGVATKKLVDYLRTKK